MSKTKSVAAKTSIVDVKISVRTGHRRLPDQTRIVGNEVEICSQANRIAA